MNKEKLNLKDKTVLITGGAGSIGKELLKKILSTDAEEVIVFSRDEIKHFLLKKAFQDDRIQTVVGDIRDYESVNKLFFDFDVDVVYHTAAMKHVIICEENPIECVKTNVFGTRNLVELARERGISKLISISTDKSANPINVMGASKFLAERITLEAGFSCVRFGNVANSRGSVIPVMLNRLQNGMPIEVSDPEATRFLMEIPNAVDLILKATDYSKGGEIFILKMKAFKLGDLLDIILDRFLPTSISSKKDVKIKRLGLVPGEKLHEILINESEMSRIYELEDMYVVLRDEMDSNKYINLKKVNMINYSSDQVDLMTKDEIENIVMKCSGAENTCSRDFSTMSPLALGANEVS